MPILKQRLEPEGAIVTVQVGLNESTVRGLRLLGQPIPQPFDCQALLDTGAEVTCVDTRLVESMNLLDVGFSFANVPFLQE